MEGCLDVENHVKNFKKKIDSLCKILLQLSLPLLPLNKTIISDTFTLSLISYSMKKK